MIDLSGTMGIPFLKKSRFTGSDGALRFVLEKRSAEDCGRAVRTAGRKKRPATAWRPSSGTDRTAPTRRRRRIRRRDISLLRKKDLRGRRNG